MKASGSAAHAAVAAVQAMYVEMINDAGQQIDDLTKQAKADAEKIATLEKDNERLKETLERISKPQAVA